MYKCEELNKLERKTKMYECSRGHKFEEDEMVVVEEDRGEFWGEPCSERYNACPICKDTDIEEIKVCESCKKKYECDEYSSKRTEECDDYVGG